MLVRLDGDDVGVGQVVGVEGEGVGSHSHNLLV